MILHSFEYLWCDQPVIDTLSLHEFIVSSSLNHHTILHSCYHISILDCWQAMSNHNSSATLTSLKEEGLKTTLFRINKPTRNVTLQGNSKLQPLLYNCKIRKLLINCINITHFIQSGLYNWFTFTVQCWCCFIQQQYPGIFHKSSRNGNPLLLSSAKLSSSFTNKSIIALTGTEAFESL